MSEVRRSSRVVKRVIVESSESEEEEVNVQPKRVRESSKARNKTRSSKHSKVEGSSTNKVDSLSKFGFQKRKGMSSVSDSAPKFSNLKKRSKSNRNKKSTGGKKSNTSKTANSSTRRSARSQASTGVSYMEQSEEDSDDLLTNSEEEFSEDSDTSSAHENDMTDDGDDHFDEGEKVSIRYEGDWYQGMVVKVVSDGYKVKFDLDGSLCVAPFKDVKALQSTKKTAARASSSRRNEKAKSSNQRHTKKKTSGKVKTDQDELVDTDDNQEDEEDEDEVESSEEEEEEVAATPASKKRNDNVNTSELLSQEYRDELAQEGWTFDHPLIGQKTRRLFRGSSASNGDGTEGGDEGAASETNGQKEEEDEEETVIIAEGVIVAFLAASDEDAPLWKNYHFQDGEVEDLEYHEVKQAKMNHRIKLKKPRGGIFAGDNEADENEVLNYSDNVSHKIDSSLVKTLEAEGWIFKTSKNFLWYPSLSKYVGTRTRRFFRQSQSDIQLYTDGMVVAFLLPNSDDPVLFKNYHLEDCQLEDLEVNEARLARQHFNQGKEKLVGLDGGVGFYDVLYADDADDDEYDGDPAEDDRWYAAVESEDLAAMPQCFKCNEVMQLQSIVGSHAATAKGWSKLLKNFATCKVGSDGSVFTIRIMGPEATEDPVALSDDAQLDDNISIKKYLIKWKNTSHLHLSWESASSLRRVFGTRAKQAMNTYVKNQEDFLQDFGVHLELEDEDGNSMHLRNTSESTSSDTRVQSPATSKKLYFVNSTWLVPERVLDIKSVDLSNDSSTWPSPSEIASNGSNHMILVKWQGLPYSSSTWELACEVPNVVPALDAFYKRERQSYSGKTRGGMRDQHLSKEAISAALPEKFENGGALRDYQRDGVTWMLFNWHRNRSSLLADEMGLGKTLQTVTYLNQLHETYKLVGPFLVVAPLSTLSHWQREFDRWTHLNAAIYTGSAEDRAMFRKHEFPFKSRPESKANKVRVLITSFEGVTNSEAHFLRNIKWSVLVVDEAHRLKNSQSKFAQALRNFEFQRSLLLTGTPLQNNTQEFWSLLNFLDPDAFASEEDFTEKFGELTQKEQLDALTAQTSRYMLRRMKEDVEKSVPPKEETRVMVELTLLQKKYYRALYEKNLTALCPKGRKASDGPSLMNVAMELRKCCNHPFLLRGIRDEVLEQNAEKFRNPDAETLAAVGGCMSRARNHLELENLIASSGKLVFLDKLLPKMEKEGHRVLIFSQFKIMLNILEEFLFGRGIIYERLDGDVTGSDRQMSIDRFQDPNSKSLVMLLSTKAGGCGINLVAADTVVIFDSDFNPQNDLQAQSRCHRIGQTKAVTIYRLLCGKTYEMKMIERASHKLALDKAVLGSHGGASTQLSKKEVERLLKEGAYDFFTDQGDETAIKFCEATIDDILKTNTSVVREEVVKRADGAGSNAFASAVYDPTANIEEKAKKLDIDDPNFWTSLGLIAPPDAEEMDLEDLDKLADRQARLKRNAKNKQTNYKESSYLNVIHNQEDVSDDSDSDDDTPAGKKKATRGKAAVAVAAPKIKAWTSKELRALASAIGQYGVGEFSQVSGVYCQAFETVYQEVLAAGPKMKKEDKNSDIARWSKSEVEEMGCWLLFTYMQVLEKASPKSKVTQPLSSVDTTASSIVADSTVAKIADADKEEAVDTVSDTTVVAATQESTEKESTAENASLATTTMISTKAAGSESSTPKSSMKAPASEDFVSLLNDYPWCRAVVASLCHFVDKKCMPMANKENVETASDDKLVPKDLKNENLPTNLASGPTASSDSESTEKEQAEGENITRNEIETKSVETTTATVVNKSISLGPIAAQFFPLLSSMKVGGSLELPLSSTKEASSHEETSGMEDEQKVDDVKIEDLKMLLKRHTPEPFVPGTSSSAPSNGSFSFGPSSSSLTLTLPAAKKTLKSMDEYWYFSEAYKLMMKNVTGSGSAEKNSILSATTNKDVAPSFSFSTLLSQVRTNLPAPWWSMSHDEALMKCVNKHGVPITARKYEICCSDEDIHWPAPLDSKLGASGMNVLQENTSTIDADTTDSAVKQTPKLQADESTMVDDGESETLERKEAKTATMEIEKSVSAETLDTSSNEAKVPNQSELVASAAAQPFPKREVLVKRIQAIIKVMKSPKQVAVSQPVQKSKRSRSGKENENKSAKKVYREDAGSKSWLQSFNVLPSANKPNASTFFAPKTTASSSSSPSTSSPWASSLSKVGKNAAEASTTVELDSVVADNQEVIEVEECDEISSSSVPSVTATLAPVQVTEKSTSENSTSNKSWLDSFNALPSAKKQKLSSHPPLTPKTSELPNETDTSIAATSVKPVATPMIKSITATMPSTPVAVETNITSTPAAVNAIVAETPQITVKTVVLENVATTEKTTTQESASPKPNENAKEAGAQKEKSSTQKASKSKSKSAVPVRSITSFFAAKPKKVVPPSTLEKMNEEKENES